MIVHLAGSRGIHAGHVIVMWSRECQLIPIESVKSSIICITDSTQK